jgi:hypothetical protein
VLEGEHEGYGHDDPNLRCLQHIRSDVVDSAVCTAVPLLLHLFQRGSDYDCVHACVCFKTTFASDCQKSSPTITAKGTFYVGFAVAVLQQRRGVMQSHMGLHGNQRNECPDEQDSQEEQFHYVQMSKTVKKNNCIIPGKVEQEQPIMEE